MPIYVIPAPIQYNLAENEGEASPEISFHRQVVGTKQEFASRELPVVFGMGCICLLPNILDRLRVGGVAQRRQPVHRFDGGEQGVVGDVLAVLALLHHWAHEDRCDVVVL